MRSPAQLYIRVRLEDGSYPYLKAVIQPNGMAMCAPATHSAQVAQ